MSEEKCNCVGCRGEWWGYCAKLDGPSEPDQVESEVADLFPETCNAATHVPRNSLCTCEDSRDE